jgi:HAD superfamily hydrolase (TIGR01509 family)
MKKKINTFIFDCFGVICSTPLFSWYKEYMTDRGFTDEKLLDIFRDYDLNRISEEDVAEYFSKYEGITSSKEEIQDQVDGYLKINTKVIDTIKQLKNSNYKIALLSNGNASFFERKIYTDYPNFKNFFDEIIISSEIGIVKPDKEIYLQALKKINSKPEESLFIDDSQTNVDGALNVGMEGFLYTDSNSFIKYIKSLGINLKD